MGFGRLQAELLGKNGHEIITLNKATRPFTNSTHDNQYDVRAKGDVVSSFNFFAKKTGDRDVMPDAGAGGQGELGVKLASTRRTPKSCDRHAGSTAGDWSGDRWSLIYEERARAVGPAR